MIPARNDHFNAAASAAAPTQRDIYPSARNSESGDLRCDPDSPDQEPQTDDRLGYPNRQSADTPKQVRGLWGEKASRKGDGAQQGTEQAPKRKGARDVAG